MCNVKWLFEFTRNVCMKVCAPVPRNNPVRCSLYKKRARRHLYVCIIYIFFCLENGANKKGRRSALSLPLVGGENCYPRKRRGKFIKLVS